MSWEDPNFISLRDLYVAYRKAKKEAYYDPNCAHGLKFSEYEKDLSARIKRLHQRLNRGFWFKNSQILGTFTYIPKSIDPNSMAENDSVHFCVSDPLEDWERLHPKRKKAPAEYRLVIDATVDFMVISALWIIKVGHKYDSSLDPRYAMGNRLRRHRSACYKCSGDVGPINYNAHSLFQPYFSAYGGWRQKGLDAMKAQLEEGHSIVAVTMDLEKFYHNIDPSFLLDQSYLDLISIELSDDEKLFTSNLLNAIDTWRKMTPGQSNGLGIPVGLTASSVIANVLLKEFDTKVVEELMPVYYGRYVDDIFLVIRPGQKFITGSKFLEWLARRLRPLISYQKNDNGPRLRLKLSYEGASELIFVGNKQKIFQLDGQSGLDLLNPIIEKIREQSSEYRLLPELPDDESDMATRALLVTPDATLEADALRKADSIMLRRMGFSLLLSDVEAHARDLDPVTWKDRRKEFYGLAERHLLSPRGIFDFYKYLPRVVGLMVSCRDWDEATCFLGRLQLVREILGQTTKPGDGAALQCWENIYKRIYEAVLQSRPIGGKSPDSGIRKILRRLDFIEIDENTLKSSDAISQYSKDLTLADWGRTSYSQLWLSGKNIGGIEHPVGLPSGQLRRFFKIIQIKSFQRRAKLEQAYWPAVVFPTRPMTVAEMTNALPVSLASLRRLRQYVSAFRGAWMPVTHGLGLNREPGFSRKHLTVPDISSGAVNVAVTNLLTTTEQWKSAIYGNPDLSLDRYDKLNSLLNSVMRAKVQPTYVALPECSLPRKWMLPMAKKLAGNNISLLAGLEYRTDLDGKVRNEALISLTTRFAGYPTHICLIQPKMAPAWAEGPEIRRLTGRDFATPPPGYLPPIYVHRGFNFGLLICSDFTDIEKRSYFQGWIDSLFVLEWNQDLNTFSSLVESGALDMHAFVVQANNRRYGDSRIRGPYKEEFKRDIVRLKGGIHDYFVIGEIKYKDLREFQSAVSPDLSESSIFKPFPIGFTISPKRRISG